MDNRKIGICFADFLRCINLYQKFKNRFNILYPSSNTIDLLDSGTSPLDLWKHYCKSINDNYERSQWMALNEAWVSIYKTFLYRHHTLFRSVGDSPALGALYGSTDVQVTITLETCCKAPNIITNSAAGNIFKVCKNCKQEVA